MNPYLGQLVSLIRLLKDKGYNIGEKEHDSLSKMSIGQYKRFLALIHNQKLEDLEQMANQFNVYKI